jgi:hypothetical protein
MKWEAKFLVAHLFFILQKYIFTTLNIFPSFIAIHYLSSLKQAAVMLFHLTSLHTCYFVSSKCRKLKRTVWWCLQWHNFHTSFVEICQFLQKFKWYDRCLHLGDLTSLLFLSSFFFIGCRVS